MPFADVENKRAKTFQKIDFFKFTPGTHTIRILEPNAELVYTHYLITPTGKSTVACLGDDCPVCANNRKIIMEHPEDFREVKGWSSRAKRYLFNVLDRTPVKTCPGCKADATRLGNNFPTSCPTCGTMLFDAPIHPSNKVRLVSTGVTLVTTLNSFEKAILTPEGEPVGLTNFDIVLQVEGSGRQQNITAIPASQNNDKVEIPVEAYQNKEGAVICLEADEILDILKGISMKDIFAARRAKKGITATEHADDAVVDSTDEVSKQVNDAVSKIFGN